MLKVKPVTKYKVPAYPTKSNATGEILAKLPLRWQKNKKVIICIGMAGAIALTGCAATATGSESKTNAASNETSGGARGSLAGDIFSGLREWFNFSSAFVQPSELFVGSHLGPVDHGGSPRMANYILAFTEQEALEIIKREAAAAGINLTESEQARGFNISSELGGTRDISINLADEELGIEIAHLHSWLGLVSQPFGPNLPLTAVSEMIQVASIPRNDDAVLGVFLNPSGAGSVDGFGSMDRAEARLEEIKDNLVMQVRDFIVWLREEGILES